MVKGEFWKEESEAADLEAAESFLSLLLEPSVVSAVLRQLRAAPLTRHRASALLRAGGLAPLKAGDAEVSGLIKQVRRGELLTPVLLLRGYAPDGVPLTVADGYSRICASRQLDPGAAIPCRIADPPGG